MRLAEVDAVAQDAEVGVREARPPVPELREQAARLGFGGLERPDSSAEDGARVAVVAAHPVRGVAFLKVLRDRILRVEGEDVLVAAGIQVEEAANAGEMAEGLAQ